MDERLVPKVVAPPQPPHFMIVPGSPYSLPADRAFDTRAEDSGLFVISQSLDKI
jgi:hypothetical protein